MDVQTENADPPPCESQPSGKIRKGFKLFGKRKPGNIFSIRSKGDGNNKSPIARSKTLDGLTETTAPDSEQEPEKEKEQEVSQGESGQAEEEPVGEDGVLAAAPPRTSISSATSARSLSFLSLLRGGRRGGGDRQVQTVSQPAGRQRRGLKSLFGSVRFRQRDKDDKEEAPPSPLLMSSRTNSVEIIKEDLTLTPKSQPRSLDSPETESCEPVKSVTTQDSSATTPSETIAPQMTAGNVSKTNEHVPPPLPTTPPPLEPGENSLSCLLADISSLLTFDSISGGGDIIADAEAEWGKASRALGTMGTGGKPLSKTPSPEPILSSSLTSTLSISTTTTAKPSPFAAPKTKGSGQASVDGQSASPSSVDTQGARTTPPKTAELQNDPRTTPQGPTRERKTPPAKTPVSKIPVVGGGRAGKLPVRDNQHTDDDGSWDPPTPVLEEERPHLHTQHGGSKDKVGEVEASVPTLKHAQEESQQPHQPKVITSVPRDSKIPVKHGAQSHTASQIPQAREPPRTKIPVSKVPVRRIAKPTAAGSSAQIRK
uniref:Si:ch211-244c8.4 n=1 Tax=Myripristis murdjan TaxID=586833 RepID=A0A667XT03_9TELE